MSISSPFPGKSRIDPPSGLQFRILPVTPFQQNCSLVWCADTAEAVVIDPGGEVERLLAEIQRQGVRVRSILLTHGHLDHVGAAPALASLLDAPILGPHLEDAFLLDSLADQATMFGFPPATAFRPGKWLEQGENIRFGNHHLDVLHCPGHTPGHLVFVETDARLAFVGDVLFRGSIGRTDFPRGNHGDLIRSIRETLFPLGDDMAFVPGHGPMGNFGQERLDNPYVGDRSA
ncbi:MAG: MBL fold metallo-hydrolase [Pseudomonadota bacterium]